MEDNHPNGDKHSQRHSHHAWAELVPLSENGTK